MPDWVLAIHAGAGAVGGMPPDEDRESRRVLADCLEGVGSALADGVGALDAVERAVALLEDCPLFNAGRGSVLTSAGAVEMDAAVMDGAARTAGAVACVRRLRNPVRAARIVMEQTPHVLLVGEGAERLASRHGAALDPPERFVTAKRRDQLERAQRASRVSLDHDEASGGSTVGAVARDLREHLAAATSTGGMTNQLPGRVGDSALVGAGTWADDRTCAVSATGRGELFVRAAFAHAVDAALRSGEGDLERACGAALARVADLGGRGGCVAVDRAGRVALPFDTDGMFRGWTGAGHPARVGIRRDEGPGPGG